MRLAHSAAHIVFIASLAACGSSRFDASDSDRGDGLDEASCGDAVEACDSFSLAFCGRASACGFESFTECSTRLEQDGWQCAFAESQDGDMDECVEEIENMACETFGSGTAFEGTECETVAIGFGDEVCESRNDDAGGGGGGGGTDITGGGNTCSCYTNVFPTTCQAVSGCYWTSSDPSDPYSSDGSCGGFCGL